MKTAKQREDDFRREFAELLAKHKAEFQVTDDGKPYGLHNGVALITMMSVYDDDELIEDYADFQL